MFVYMCGALDCVAIAMCPSLVDLTDRHCVTRETTEVLPVRELLGWVHGESDLGGTVLRCGRWGLKYR